MEQLTPEQIEKLQSDFLALQKAHGALEADHLSALEQNDALVKENEARKTEVASLNSKLYALAKENASLKSIPASVREGKAKPSFEYAGKKYEVVVPKVEIPRLGIRTALEITQDKAAQKHLVEVPGNIGPTIREVK